jgi:hypothetical protein
MARAQSQWQVDAGGISVKVTCRRQYSAIGRDDKGAIQLSQFLSGLPHVEIRDLLQLWRVPLQRI